MTDTVLTIRNLGFAYTSGPAAGDLIFKALSCELRWGEILCIVGPSGCGKTTLLNLIAGFVRPDHGEIRFSDGDIPNRKMRLGYIFQFDALLPWRTVHGNLLLGPEVTGCNGSHVNEQITEFLQIFNLDPDILEKYPSQLSGGMRQRVAIIQSLLYDPYVLLLDEPFGSLDFYTKLRLEHEFVSMVRRKHVAAIVVTHDIDEAIAIGHRVIVMGAIPAGIVREFVIDFGPGDRSPQKVRGEPRFADYFASIWAELQEGMTNASEN